MGIFGLMRYFIFFISIFLFMSSVNSWAEPVSKTKSITFKSLVQMDELTALGVPALALSLLEHEQDVRQKYTADWYAFEYRRINLLIALEHWQKITDRTQWLFDTALPEKQITQKIRLWFETQQVMAKLHLKQNEQALTQLQRLLWLSSAEDRDPSLPSIWRRLVIRAYLQMKNDDDARRALIKYDRDYKAKTTNSEWLLLQAQVLMKTGRPQQAMPLLKQVDSDEGQALMLLAELQNEPTSAKKISQKIKKRLNTKVDASARWAYSYVAFQAAKKLSDVPLQIQYAETLLTLNVDQPILDETYQITADDLWALYKKSGLSVADVIENRKPDLELISQLYLHSEQIDDIGILPEAVRYQLVDYALSAGKYADASTVMQSLQQPPKGKSNFEWRMRKARVLIMQGEYEQSEKIIRQTMREKNRAKKNTITSAELDHYIQVVFDFQTVQQHQQAINLFELISFEQLSEKLKREIYFWKAESFFALKQYDRAALNYLSSARAVTNEGNDLWAQSARFKSAKSLVLAEIFDDARKIYRDLLLVTESESRRTLIKQNLQKIRLLESVK
jgi:hypothetical protein